MGRGGYGSGPDLERNPPCRAVSTACTPNQKKEQRKEKILYISDGNTDLTTSQMMTDYAAQYYILRRANNDALPYLKPNEDSLDRVLSLGPQPLGSPRLMFSNELKERNKTKRIKEIVTPVLFHGNDMVVSSSIREALLDLDLPCVHLHPAVYMDDVGSRHEGYWHVTFSRRFDCWDRDLSEKSESSVAAESGPEYDVYEYVLDEKLLDDTPLKERLLFQIGGTIDSFVFCHESIVQIFRRETPLGLQILLVTHY